jgi:hypothetical protein
MLSPHPAKPQRLTDVALQVLQLFIDAAERKGDDWQNSGTIFDDGENPILSLIEKVEKKETELEEQLERSYTPEQRAIIARIKLMEEQSEIYSKEDLKTQDRLLEASYTPAQNSLLDQWRRFTDAAVRSHEMLEVQDSSLRIDLPKSLTPSQADAVMTLLSAASSGAFSFNTVEDIYGLLNSRNTGRDLKDLIPAVDGRFRAQLQDPSRWQRVKTKQGIGYISWDAPEVLVFALAHNLSSGMNRRDWKRIYRVDGAIIDSLMEFTLSKGEKKEIGIILFGDAAKEIIGEQLGVDMAKIKDASPTQGRE